MHRGQQLSAVIHVHDIVNHKQILIKLITSPAQMSVGDRGLGLKLALLCHLVER